MWRYSARAGLDEIRETRPSPLVPRSWITSRFVNKTRSPPLTDEDVMKLKTPTTIPSSYHVPQRRVHQGGPGGDEKDVRRVGALAREYAGRF